MADIATTPQRIVVVTEGGAHAWGLVNAILGAFDAVTVIVETPTRKSAILRGRLRRLGLVSVAGQLGTMLIIRATKTLRRPGHTAGADLAPPPPDRVIRIDSANSAQLPQAIDGLGATVVMLVGCRMLSRATLQAISCPVLNYHAGITPQYRGVNGGYWALADGDPQNFGATVHMVDEGVDTGAVLYQVLGSPMPGDTIASYPMTQAALAREICVRAIADALDGTLRPVKVTGVSMQRYHPTLWAYLWTGLRRGVW